MSRKADATSPLSRATPLLAAALTVLTGVFWFTGGNRIGQAPPSVTARPPTPGATNDTAAEALWALMQRPPTAGQPTAEGTRHDLGETAFGQITTLTVRADGQRVVAVEGPAVPIEAFGTILESRGVRVIVNGPLEGASVTATPDGWTVTFPGS